jgi:hypothetical protein
VDNVCRYRLQRGSCPRSHIPRLNWVNVSGEGAVAGLRAIARQYPRTVAVMSAEEFLKDGGSPGWNLFVGKELRADLQSGFRGVDVNDIGEQAEVVDVPGPGGEGLHREDVAW